MRLCFVVVTVVCVRGVRKRGERAGSVRPNGTAALTRTSPFPHPNISFVSPFDAPGLFVRAPPDNAMTNYTTIYTM